MSAPVSEGEAIRRGSEVRLPRLTVSGLEVLLELRRPRTQGRASALNHQQIAHAALTLKPQRDHPRNARAHRMARYHGDAKPCRHRLADGLGAAELHRRGHRHAAPLEEPFGHRPGARTGPARDVRRSEEHTSELQSLAYLVC